MRKIKLLTFAAGIITLMSCLPAMAQLKVEFTTSFGFYAGSAKLPAGTYTLRQQQNDPSSFEIQDASGKHSSIVQGRQLRENYKRKPAASLQSVWDDGIS